MGIKHVSTRHLGHQEQTDLDQVPMRLQEDGLPPATSPEEHQLHLRQQLLDTEAELQLSNQELHLLRSQQANEKKEVRYFPQLQGSRVLSLVRSS